MKKTTIIAIIFLIFASALILIFGGKIRDSVSSVFVNEHKYDYLYGSEDGTIGKLSLKLRVDSAGSIKEVYVLEHPNNDKCEASLQKLISNTIDKRSVDEIENVPDDAETSELYKSIIAKLLKQSIDFSDKEESDVKILMNDPEIASNIERQVIEGEGYKSGVGGYVYNQFQDADYDKNGNLVTNEYICAVLLNPNNRIEDVRFDHITSNISFDRNGKVPTGGAKAYVFKSDKEKVGFNGLINDGNYINIYDFEKEVLTYRHYEDIKNRYINKKGYAPLVYALENAMDNARVIGAGQGNNLGLSCYKVLKKNDIKDANGEENGKVKFSSTYCMTTVNKDMIVSSVMFDKVQNDVVLTSNGRILGSREKEVYTLNELANINKYSKIDLSKYTLKLEHNFLADYLRGSTIDVILNVISSITDNKGKAKEDTPFATLKNIDFIEYIDIISRAYVDAIKIKN